MELKQYRGSFLVLGLIGAVLLTAASGQVAKKSKTEPLMIQEQGSFAVGGKVCTNSGTFNPKQPTPDGQTLHGDHAMPPHSTAAARLRQEEGKNAEEKPGKERSQSYRPHES